MKIKDKSEWMGNGLALISVILGSLGPPVFKKFIEGVGMNIGISYMLILGGMATIFFYAFPKLLQAGKKGFKIFRAAVAVRLLFLGIFTILAYLCYAIAMDVGSVTETVVLTRLSALFVVFLSVRFLKEEKMRSYSLIGIAVVFCSVGLIMSQFQGNGLLFQKINMSLMFYGILAAIFLAGSFVLQRYLESVDGLDKISVVAISMVIGGVLMAVQVFATGGKFIFPNVEQLILLLFLGFGTIAIPTVLSMDAFKSIGVSRVSFVNYLMPLFSGVVAFFLNNERGFNYYYLITGFGLITLGVICTKYGIKKIDKKL